MILAVGLSPAWQQILEFDQFAPGQVNRARNVYWCASGKVLNVAIAAKHLGAPCEAITVLGGESGASIEREFRELEIPLIVVRTAAATRICTTILSENSPTTELVENAGPILASELASFRELFTERARQADYVVITGSLPGGIEPEVYRELIAGCGERAVLDIRGPELLAALQHRPLLVKPNRYELEHTLGCQLDSDEAVWAAMQELQDRGARWTVVTDGANPLRIAGPDGRWRAQPVKVMTVNPIGCGDCLTAGIAAGLDRDEEMLQSIRYGIAAAAVNAEVMLPGRLDPNRVTELVRQVSIVR